MEVSNITTTHVALQLFPGYSEADTAIFKEFLNSGAKPEPGFIVDFLGSRIRTASLWKEARALDGQLLGIPVPADFHAEAIEWIGLLKAVRGADGQYVAMELGAGFGPWVVAGGRAAKLRGIEDIRLYAVEGDPRHFRFLRQHFADNGFEPDRHELLEAAVGTAAGVAEWPMVDDTVAAEEWGLRPVTSNVDYRGQSFESVRKVNMVPMLELVVKEPCWDLIHIDVQGAEVDICRSCIDELTARVRWIVAATHSRKIDGDLLELMCRAGWILEHEKPAKFNFVPNASTLEAMTTVDGTQVWRNPLLTGTSEGDRLTSFSQEISSPIHELQLAPACSYAIEVTVKNTGAQPWFARQGEAMSIVASCRWLDNNGNVLPIEGIRTSLRGSVIRPGESDILNLRIVAPPQPGSYALLVSMVQEGVDWFYLRNAKPLVLQAKVG